MLLVLLVIFVAFPIVELTILFKLGDEFGWLATLAIVLGAGMAGAAVARLEGLRAAMRVRQQLARGTLPAAEMFDGLLIAAAGVLLVIPGVVSDVAGLVLLLPPTRALVRRALMHWVRTRFRLVEVDDFAHAGPNPPRRGDVIIDARVIETRVRD
jgi:UPF0716 protein FxsA